MIIKHIDIHNFMGVKELSTDFYQKTSVSGANGTGKTCLRNAIMYVLLNKLADGSAADGIRPHGKDGVDVDYVDITVALTVEIDGRDVELKKIEKQKWVKHRGSESPIFEGNETSYEVNGIPKKAKDFASYINDIVDAETLLYGTNAQALLSLDTKKRRAKIMSLVGDSSLESIAAADEKYAEITPMLADGTIDELIARSRKIIKAKNDDLKAIPVRIDEVSKQKVDIDTAELELHRNGLKEQIAKINDEISSGSNRAELNDLQDQKMSLQFEIGDCRRKASEELLKKRHDLNRNLTTFEMQADDTRSGIAELERRIAGVQQTIEADTAEIEEMKPQYQAAKEKVFDASSWVFDESTTVCSLCGQTLPDERIKALRTEFEVRKSEAEKKFNKERDAEIERIKTTGNEKAVKVKEAKKWIEDHQSKLSGLKEALKAFDEQIADLKSKLALLPTEADLTENKEYQALLGKEQELDRKIAVLESQSVDTQALEEKKAEIESELQAVDSQIARATANAEIDERIAELTQQQRTLAQEIANEERRRDLLEDLNKRYVEVLTDKVNSYFKVVKWRMFKPLITNSGYDQICEPCIDGTSYYRNLNHGNRILAELDICQTFQNIGGVKLPITIDDAESVDSWRIPDVDRQLIIFKRTDDKSLMVKEM